MSERAVANLSLARLVQLEQRVLQAEDSGLRARWDFGRDLLLHCDDKGNLPRGFVKEIAAECNVEPERA